MQTLKSDWCLFQLTKYEHKGVSESIEFDDTSFSSVFLAE